MANPLFLYKQYINWEFAGKPERDVSKISRKHSKSTRKQQIWDTHQVLYKIIVIIKHCQNKFKINHPKNVAMRQVAYCYEYGVGVEKNVLKSFKIYEDAVKAGNVKGN